MVQLAKGAVDLVVPELALRVFQVGVVGSRIVGWP
jgi:hypothetical protein